MTKVKICGINDPAAFDTAIEAGADWVGFVFFPPSPRSVTPEFAGALSGRIAGGPPRVGLFVEPDVSAIGRVLERVKLDVLQIYGAVGDLEKIKAQFGLPVWRAVGINKCSRPADRCLRRRPAGPGGQTTRGGQPARRKCDDV